MEKETKVKISGEGIPSEIEVVINNLKAADVPDKIEFVKNSDGTFNITWHNMYWVDKTTGNIVLCGTMTRTNVRVGVANIDTCFPTVVPERL